MLLVENSFIKRTYFLSEIRRELCECYSLTIIFLKVIFTPFTLKTCLQLFFIWLRYDLHCFKFSFTFLLTNCWIFVHLSESLFFHKAIDGSGES